MNKRKKIRRDFESFEPRLLLTAESALPLVSIGNQEVVSFFDTFDGPRVVSGDMIDLNHDDMLDFVVGTSDPVGIRFFVAKADGSVEQAAVEKVRGEVVDIVSGDINGDGWEDVVLATDSRVFTFVNQGVDEEGALVIESGEIPISGVNSLTLENLNGDQLLDLVLGTVRNVEVRLGQVGALFGESIDYLSGRGDKHVAAADLDQDGDVDLVVANRETEKATVMLNDGDGIFESAHLVDDVGQARTLALAHLDDDEYIDLLVGSWEQEGPNLLIWRGAATGSFQDAPTHYEIVGSPLDIAVGDINLDGHQDVVVGHDSTFHHPITNNGPGGVSLLMGNAVGGLSPSVRVATPGAPDVIVRSEGLDQKPEILAFQQWQNTAVRFQWAEQALFDVAVDYASAVVEPFSWKATVIGDFDGNGSSDVVAVDRWREQPQSSVHLRQTDGSYLERSFALPNNAVVSELLVGDFNGDGLSDLAVDLQFGNDRQRGVLFAVGDGDFSEFTRLNTGNSSAFTVKHVVDMNGDGFDDLVGFVSGPAVIASVISNGDGSWEMGERKMLARDAYVQEMRVTDLNNDNKLDAFVVTNIGIHTAYGDGLGGFETPITKQVDVEIYSVGDLNGDGFLDVATKKFDSQPLDLLFGNDRGTFEVQRVNRGPASFQLAMFDISGDGQDELLSVDQTGFESFVWVDGQFQSIGYTNIGFAPGLMSNVDIDGDADLDVVISQSQGFISSSPSTQVAVLIRSGVGLTAPIVLTTPIIDGVIGEISVAESGVSMTLLHRNGFAIVSGGSGLNGDFNGDGEIGIDDLDLLCAVVRQDTTSAEEIELYDLDQDNVVGESDVDVWIAKIANTARGDLDLDGRVGFLDFLILANNFGGVDAIYSQGDINCDGQVTFNDFLLLAANFGST